MTIVEEYLKHLNEDYKAKILASVGSNIRAGVSGSLFFGLLVTPAVITAWRTSNYIFSNSVRKCGGILASRKPGFKVCVSKEKIKALNMKIQTSKNILSKCSESKTPDLCKQKLQLQIEKSKNKIEIEQNKMSEILGEAVLGKVAATALKVGGTAGGLGVMIATGIVADKAIFLTLRSAKAMFSSAARKCGVYKKEGAERSLCVSKIKFTALNKQLLTLNRWLATCARNKNPDACKQKVQSKIENTNKKLEMERNNIKAYQNEINIEKREEEFKEAQKREKKIRSV